MGIRPHIFWYYLIPSESRDRVLPIAPSDPIKEHIRKLRPLDEKGKTAYLQNLIGDKVDPEKQSHVLDYRAKLMSALNNAKVWPHRGAGEERD